MTKSKTPTTHDDTQAAEPEREEPTTTNSEPRSRRTNKRRPNSVTRSDKGTRRKSYDASRRIDRKTEAEIVQLASKGLSVQQIVRTTGRSQNLVSKVLAHYTGLLKELEHVSEYRRGRADLLAAGQLLAIKSMSDKEVLAKASYNQLAYGFTQLFTAERLERGQSTGNTQTFTTVRLEHIPSGRGEEVEISTAPQPEKKE